jgi:hypothetical protein
MNLQSGMWPVCRMSIGYAREFCLNAKRRDIISSYWQFSHCKRCRLIALLSPPNVEEPYAACS